METTKTYTQVIGKEQNSLLWNMALETARAYNFYIKTYNENKDYNSCDKLTEKEIKREYLHSQSFQAAYQLAKNSIIGFFASIKAYQKNPSGFTDAPRFPTPDKRIQTLMFKKSAIRFKDGFLLLSSAFKKNPIKIKWNSELDIPIFATIKMEHRQWKASFVFKENKGPKKLGDGILAIDLGIKRLAATFNGKSSDLYNGKLVMSLVQLENKKQREIDLIKEARRKKYTRAQKRKLNGTRKQKQKAQRIKKDILHKYSRHLVNKAIDQGVGTIVAGDCSSIHQIEKQQRRKGSKGEQKEQAKNQKVNQGQEQRLWKMIKYKFEREGGKAKLTNESFSTQTCPVCGNRHKPKDRIYSCECGFSHDRDAVGAINIYNKVSQTSLRSGRLARPSGLKYNPQLSYKATCSEDRSSNE